MGNSKNSASVTDGQSTARPRFGETLMPRLLKTVSPPASTSERKRKRVRSRGPMGNCGRGRAGWG